MRLAAQAKGGYYPTPDRVVDMIADLIHTPTNYSRREGKTLRVLDPCCGAGDAVARLAERLNGPNSVPVETYGIELHRDRAVEAARRLDRALAADLFQTSIGTGAFGLAYLNPPYDWDAEDKRVEHAFLTRSTRHLVDGGLLVFIVPRRRLAVSARYLSTHYARMQCWAFPEPEREVFDQVVLMGYRKTDPSPDANAERMALEWAEGEPKPLRFRTHPEFTPPTVPMGGRAVRHPHGRSRRRGRGGPAVGAVGQRGDNRHAVAREGRPHPSADAPAKGTSGDAGGGGVPRQPLP